MTSLLLSLISNFIIVEKQGNFKVNGVKFNQLCHKIDTKLTNDIDNITAEQINNYILEYDAINESIEYDFLNFVKKRVKNKYVNTRILPNILNCIHDFTIQPPSGASV